MIVRCRWPLHIGTGFAKLHSNPTGDTMTDRASSTTKDVLIESITKNLTRSSAKAVARAYSYVTGAAAEAGEDGEIDYDLGQSAFTVSGYYLPNHQPYTQHVFAQTPEEAVRKAFEAAIENNNIDVNADVDEAPLLDLVEATGLEIVSISRGHHDEAVSETDLF